MYTNMNQKPFHPNCPSNQPPLTNNETITAKDILVKNISNFPSINRRYTDTPKPGEPKFALFSFINHDDTDMCLFLNEIKDGLNPKNKKKLDSLMSRKNVVKGVAKIRGAYMTQQEANERAEEIVRDIDSTNSIFTCIIGVPFPLVSEGMADEVSEVDLQQQTEHTIAQNVRKQRNKDRKEMDEIKRREEELLRNAEKDPNADDEENYISQRVKLAHLRYCIDEHVKKQSECISNEKKVVAWLVDMKTRNPDFEEKYMEKYMAGRKAAHIPDDYNLEGFMKYMNDPLVKLG